MKHLVQHPELKQPSKEASVLLAYTLSQYILFSIDF